MAIAMSDQSADAVTLLFSDIEGSTRRWEHHPRAMAVALARHDAILRSAIVEAGGEVFKTVGDAFCAVFPGPDGALAAAVAAQRALATESWVEIGGLRVRMAIHSGVTEQRDHDYFGPSVNRVARLLGAAHGGQILVSARVADQARTEPGAGIAFRDLGQHRLRDLIEPERLYQLLAPDLPADFPPPKTLDSQLRTLPVPPTPLIGRDQEVATVRSLLAISDTGGRGTGAARLVTLTGPGGAGKTRLSLHLAATLAPEFADGVVFVPLAPLTEPSLVLQEIATRLEVPDPGEVRTREDLIAQLEPLDLFMVLDNFEQVMDATPIVAELLAACPRLTVLATSRERLNLRGERELPVPPLPLPAPSLLSEDFDRHQGGIRLVERVSESAAVQLFLERATATKPSFELTADNAAAVAEICRRLDGLPLAIELAAARIRLMTPAAMLSRLDRRLDLLAGGARDLPSRQQTMRNTVAWSYDLLSADEQRLFARLAVFSGGATTEAADAILELDGIAAEAERLDFGALEMLIDKSLIRLDDGAGLEPRITMFETIRDYAAEQLSQGDEAELVARWHGHYYLDRAVEAVDYLDGPAQTEWLNRLEQDHANLRAALVWLRSHDPAAATKLGGALWRFWQLRGHFTEGRSQLDSLVQIPIDAVDLIDRIAVLNGAGVLAEGQGDVDRAGQLHAEALAIARLTGDKEAIAWSLNNLGVVACGRGEYDLAESLLNENLALARELGDLGIEAMALTDLGNVAFYRGDAEGARSRFQSGLDLFRRLGDDAQVANTLNNLGSVEIESGSYAAAEVLLNEALHLSREVGHKQGIAYALNNLAEAAGQQGDLDRATSLYRDTLRLAQDTGDRKSNAIALENLARIDFKQGDDERAGARYAEALVLYHTVGDWIGITSALAGIATIAARRGQPEVATRLLAAAAGFADSAGVDHSAEPDLIDSDALRAMLGDATFAATWLVGQGMAVDRVIAEATAFIMVAEHS